MKNPTPFTYKTFVHLDQTDAIGRIFFNQIFKIAYDASEAWLLHNGLPVATIVKNKDYLTPIVHAQTDISAPLTVGDEVLVRLTVERIGQTSFTLAYLIEDNKGRTVATVKTVHVTISKASGEKINLPPCLLAVLKTAV